MPTLSALQEGFKEVASILNFGLRTPCSGIDDDAPARMDVGGDVAAIDQRAAHVLLDALAEVDVFAVALETHEGIVSFDAIEERSGRSSPGSVDAARPRVVVVLCPLNGASNADAGASAGTIFGLYALPRREAEVASLPNTSHVLRRGSELLAAGYALYGAATQLIFSCGHGVDGFTLNPEKGEFVLTRPQMQIPRCGRFYSVNHGHRKGWSKACAEHIDLVAESKSLRYIGTFVGDIHRTLLYGGVFFYPADSKRPHGKLRLLYQAAPMAFLIEQAGGAASTGHARLLDLTATSPNQKVPVCMGSVQDVDDYVNLCWEAGGSDHELAKGEACLTPGRYPRPGGDSPNRRSNAFRINSSGKEGREPASPSTPPSHGSVDSHGRKALIEPNCTKSCAAEVDAAEHPCQDLPTACVLM
jgi:fructose-1,6-bisphosphatase I